MYEKQPHKFDSLPRKANCIQQRPARG